MLKPASPLRLSASFGILLLLCQGITNATDFPCKEQAKELNQRPLALREETPLFVQNAPTTTINTFLRKMSSTQTSTLAPPTPSTHLISSAIIGGNSIKNFTPSLSGTPKESSIGESSSLTFGRPVSLPHKMVIQVIPVEGLNGIVSSIDSTPDEKLERILAGAHYPIADGDAEAGLAEKKRNIAEVIKHKTKSVEQTIEIEKGEKIVAALPPNSPAGSNADILRKMWADAHSGAIGVGNNCTAALISSYGKAAVALEQSTTSSAEYIAADYLADGIKFAKSNSADQITRVQEYVSSMNDMLDACYIPAEKSRFVVANPTILNRIGIITIGDELLCTGLLVGTGQYILTARHCFVFSNPSPDIPKNLWFHTASGTDRYQLCALAEKDALAPALQTKVADDQVLARIAIGLPSPTPLVVLPSTDLLVAGDTATNNFKAPTLLVQLSLFPAAALLNKSKYPSGLVQGITPYCAPLEKHTGCYLSTCSAVSGSSGSAIFVASAPTLTIAGTHVGGMPDATDCTGKNVKAYNAIAYPNTKWLSAITP